MKHEIERLRSRRKALMLLGSGVAGGVSSAFTRTVFAQGGRARACIVRPHQTEGPYFVDARLNRSDIRSDPATGAIKTGIPLRVTFKVSRVSESICVPFAGVQVDLWHCDAVGAYSNVRDAGGSTMGQKFLRGYQVTDADGSAAFTTIYPGWYRGRTVHLHFKLRTMTSSRTSEFTSQVYFEDALNDRVLALAPYAGRGRRDVRNDEDGLFARGGGRLILSLAQDGQGYAGSFDIGLNIG